ncbi:MAG: hypothetical protein ACPG5T_08285, partial [Endozoicomonas sp.]
HANCTRDSYRGSGEVAVDKALERLKIEKALRKPPKAIEPDTSSSIAVKAKAFSPETQQQKSQASYPYKAPSPSTPDIWIPPWEQK